MKNYIVCLKVAGAFLLGTLLSPSVYAQDSPAENLERRAKQDLQRIVQQTGATIQAPAQSPPQGTTTPTQPAGKAIAAAGEPEKVAIYVDGIELWRSVYSGAIREQILLGPWATRPSNYLINDSPLDAALRPIYHVQEAMTFNGDLTDAKQLRLAVDALKETITKHSGARVDLITHSLGTVIAYTALAELAKAGETQPDVTISKPNVTNFITLGSPLGREAILVNAGAALAGLNIPLPSSISTPRALNIQGRWLNVFHVKDLIGDKIQAFGVINVALQGSDAFQDANGESSAHSFPYQGLESIRLIADVIRGNHARLSDIAANVPTATGSATQPSPTGPENEPHTFDGEWLSPEFGYGFRVQGLTGIAIQSNSPTFKPGDVILRFKSTGTNTFSGEQICTDGKFYPVTGTLRSDGVLAMTVQGCSPPTWNMLRKPSGLANATLNRSWYSPEWKYGVAIKGNTGIITQSNLPNMKVGDTSLKITTNANNSFDGEHLCTDGKFHPMHGTLGYDGRLYLTVPECTPGIIYLLPVGALATDSPTGPETPSPEAAPKPSSAIQSAACSEPVIQPGMSGKDAALVLGPVKESDRNSAIAAMVRGGKLRNPLCAEEVALILKGTTQVYRANSIAVLVPVIKSQLSGKEAAMILGSAQECAESNRYSAIAVLARGKKIKSLLLGEELEMILDGTTGVYRSTAIGVLSAK